MAGRELEWIDYDVSLPASLLPQMRSLVIAQAAAPEPGRQGRHPWLG